MSGFNNFMLERLRRSLSLAGEGVKIDPTIIDHDALKNFLAAEHVDWAAASAGTIDPTNYDFKVPTFLTANSLTKQTGGTETGGISDTQTIHDGNHYMLDEVTGTPGFNVEFNFTSIGTVHGFAVRLLYNGASTHYSSVDLYNYTNAAWDEYLYLRWAGRFEYLMVFVPGGSDYVDGSNNAKLRIYHHSGGNAAHDVRVEYIAILGLAA